MDLMNLAVKTGLLAAVAWTAGGDKRAAEPKYYNGLAAPASGSTSGWGNWMNGKEELKMASATALAEVKRHIREDVIPFSPMFRPVADAVNLAKKVKATTPDDVAAEGAGGSSSLAHAEPYASQSERAPQGKSQDPGRGQAQSGAEPRGTRAEAQLGDDTRPLLESRATGTQPPDADEDQGRGQAQSGAEPRGARAEAQLGDETQPLLESRAAGSQPPDAHEEEAVMLLGDIFEQQMMKAKEAKKENKAPGSQEKDEKKETSVGQENDIKKEQTSGGQEKGGEKQEASGSKVTGKQLAELLMNAFNTRNIERHIVWIIMSYKTDLETEERKLRTVLLDTSLAVWKRRGAATSLGQFGAAADGITVAILREALWDGDVCEWAAAALIDLGAVDAETIATLRAAAFEGDDDRVSMIAMNVLGQFGAAADVDGETGAALRKMLLRGAHQHVGGFDNSDLRRRAVNMLSEFGADVGGETIAVLQKVLRGDLDWRVRRKAALALGRFGTLAVEPMVSSLQEALENGEWCVKGPVAKALGDLGAVVRGAAIAILRKVILGNNWEVMIEEKLEGMMEAARSLRKLGAAADPEIVTAVREALQYGDDTDKVGAAQLLGHLGAADGKTVAALREALEDDCGFVRERAAEALFMFSRNGKTDLGGKTVAALRKVLRDVYLPVRWAAAAALGNLGADDWETVAALRLALQHEHSRLRSTAAEALRKLGATDKAPAVPATGGQSHTLAAEGLGDPKEIRELFGALAPTVQEYSEAPTVPATGGHANNTPAAEALAVPAAAVASESAWEKARALLKSYELDVDVLPEFLASKTGAHALAVWQAARLAARPASGCAPAVTEDEKAAPPADLEQTPVAHAPGGQAPWGQGQAPPPPPVQEPAPGGQVQAPGPVQEHAPAAQDAGPAHNDATTAKDTGGGLMPECPTQ